jgi:hypothetical protein
MSMRQFNAAADNAGRIPQEGDYVAYNYSGQIACGFITKIGVTRSRYWSGPIYHIMQVLPEEGHKSKVKGGPKCVLVLQSEDAAKDVRPLKP